MTQQPGRPRKALPGLADPADRFAALADPTRRHMLEQLAGRDLAAGPLTSGLDISQAAVSQHLRVLRDAGLVTARKEGRNRYYQLRPAALTELRDWLDAADPGRWLPAHSGPAAARLPGPGRGRHRDCGAGGVHRGAGAHTWAFSAAGSGARNEKTNAERGDHHGTHQPSSRFGAGQ